MVVCGPCPGSTTAESRQRQHLGPQALQHVRGAAAGQVGSADRAGEQARRRRTTIESIVGLGGRRIWNIIEPGVCPGACSDPERQPGHRDLNAVCQLADVVGLGEGLRQRRAGPAAARVSSLIARNGSVSSSGRAGWIQQAGRVVGAQRRDGEHVVEMPVGQQHGDRLEPVLAHHVARRRRAASMPGSMITHSAPGSVATT